MDNSSSITTIYKNAVVQDKLNVSECRNISSSSDDFNDTSDDSLNLAQSFIAGCSVRNQMKEKAAPQPSTSGGPGYEECHQRGEKELTPEERSDQIIKDAECSKARMYELSGKNNFPAISQIEDYQMIDAHIDDSLRAKILKFEFINLARLLPKAKGGLAVEEEYQRLEIVNKNGISFLSPVSDRETVPSAPISNSNKRSEYILTLSHKGFHKRLQSCSNTTI